MTLLLSAFILAVFLILVSFVQLLYLESLRLRTRESDALEFFKDSLQDMIGYDSEDGSLTFSLIKHSLIAFAGSIVVTATLIHTPNWIGFVEGLAIAWLLMLFSSYLVPQLLYRRTSGGWLIPLIPLIRFLALIIRPLTALFRFLNSLQSLAQPASEDQEESNPAEDFEALINAGEEEGIIEKEDSRLIHSVVAFGDKRVREVMTPRRQMITISAASSLDDLRSLARNEQFSRIPVFGSSVDNIIGFVHVRDLFELLPGDPKRTTIADLMRPILGVPETKPASDLVKEMSTSGNHIVYVVDEYGNVAGLVTLEDLMEEVFGEIRDEHEPAHDLVRNPDGSVTVSGSFDVDHLHELFGFRPDEETESTTIGGLVTEWLGEVPPPGAAVERDGLRLDVLAADALRVIKVRVSRAPDFDGHPPEPA
ncbi:MAG: HlyC/CorC family transporter [Candidatus Solibacter sp.]|nr:HlyC/CorC family transporter [Candidatus Solibacter sp.]